METDAEWVLVGVRAGLEQVSSGERQRSEEDMREGRWETRSPGARRVAFGGRRRVGGGLGVYDAGSSTLKPGTCIN